MNTHQHDTVENPQPIFDGEFMNYTRHENWMNNNGFRRRWLVLGLKVAREWRDATGESIPAYRVVTIPNRFGGPSWRGVVIPYIFKSGRRKVRLQWLPMFGVSICIMG